MANSTHVATTTGRDNLTITPIKRVNSPELQVVNGVALTDADKLRRYAKKKYRHVAAVHTDSKTSCLSHESKATPSFVGFRNLMVLTLVVGNGRLMLENIRKVCVRKSKSGIC